MMCAVGLSKSKARRLAEKYDPTPSPYQFLFRRQLSFLRADRLAALIDGEAAANDRKLACVVDQLRGSNHILVSQPELVGSTYHDFGLDIPETHDALAKLTELKVVRKVERSLDVFTVNEGRDLIKLAPTGSGVRNALQSLRAANENLLYADPRFLGGKAKTINEITYADEAGVMQFMRRTLLAGAFKFDQYSTQVLPHAFLKQFQDYLLRVSRLVCIGYACGDTHINQILRHWLVDRL